MDENKKKREYIRINDEFNVRIVVRNIDYGETDLEINTSKSINVSAAGLLIHTNEKLHTGAILSVIFMKPHSYDFFKSSGKVVWIEQLEDKSYKIGINFIDLSPQNLETLNYYLQLGK